MTNRHPGENTVTVEVVSGPSASEFEAAAIDEWSRTGVWSVVLSTEGVDPGTDVLEVTDGDNTDRIRFEVIPLSTRQL